MYNICTNFKRPLVKIFWYSINDQFSFFLNLNQQSNLMKYHGLQCGFCTPGMVMTMYTLFRNNPSPTPDDLERALEGRKQNANSFFFCSHNCNSRIVLCAELNETVNIYNKIVISNACDETLSLNAYCILHKRI